MKNKKCNGCLKIKPVSEFGKESRAKNGYKPRCKDCVNRYYREKYHSTKKMRDTKKKNDRRYYKENKKRINSLQKEYAKKNRPAIRKYMRKYRQETDYYEKQNEYMKERYRNDPEFRAYKKLRRLVSRVTEKKTDTTINILGYGVKELQNHLGRLPKMGECLDHKIPISWFNFNTPPRIVNDLRNMQILSRSENSKKSNRRADPVCESYYKDSIKWIKTKHKNEVNYE